MSLFFWLVQAFVANIVDTLDTMEMTTHQLIISCDRLTVMIPTNMPTNMSLKAVMHTVDAIHMFHATCNGPMPIHNIFYTFRAISRPIHQGEALDFVQRI